MSTITINNPTTAIIEPTSIVNNPITLDGNGEVKVNFTDVINDGNITKTLTWNISDIQNATFVTFQTEMDSVVNHNKSGTVEVAPNKTVKIRAFFNVPAGQPGVKNLPATANYSIKWQ